MFYKSSSHIKTAFSGDERKRTLQHVGNSFARSSCWCKVQNSSNYPPATNEGGLVRRGLKDLGNLAKFALKSGVYYSEFRNSRKRINDVVLQGFVCIDKNNLLSFLLQMQKWSIMAGDLLQNK
jgi:hypothetical protein